MRKVNKIKSICVPLLKDNIDTDMIIPSREMRSTSKSGLKDGLFAPWRYINEAERTTNPDFILNQACFQDATIILAGKNFGCGSSREHAVWALIEYGFEAILAESFAPIFHNNALRNGLLTIELDLRTLEQFSNKQIEIDLARQTIVCGLQSIDFSMDGLRRQMLMAGLDEIDFTLTHFNKIATFFETQELENSWIKIGDQLDINK